MIRKILCFPLLATVCGFASLHADLTIIEHVDGMGTAIDSTEMFAAGHTRVDYSPGLSTIRDLKSGEVIRLMHTQKSYARIPGHLRTALDGVRVSRVVPRDAGLALTPTGKRDTISGYPAQEYAGRIAGMKMSLWLTKAAPDDTNLLKEMTAAIDKGAIGGRLTGMGLDMAALPGFPVRLVMESPSGQTSIATILAVSTAPVADSEFDIPADYKEVILPLVSPLAPSMPAAAVRARAMPNYGNFLTEAPAGFSQGLSGGIFQGPAASTLKHLGPDLTAPPDVHADNKQEKENGQ